jgi:hypothetical protein
MKENNIFDDGKIEKVVLYGLRDTFNAHGPITKEHFGSACKRISNSIKGILLANYRDKDVENAEIERLVNENRKLKKKIEKFNKKNKEDYLNSQNS